MSVPNATKNLDAIEQMDFVLCVTPTCPRRR